MPTARAKPNNAMRRRELIRRSLFLGGITQAAIARRAGVSRGMVCHVVAGRKAHIKVQAALARACGIRNSHLWED